MREAQRSWRYDHDFYSGVVRQQTDSDNNVSTSYDFDAFGRPVTVIEPDGKVTTTAYQDGSRYTTVTTSLDAGRSLFSVRRHDQIGRVWLEQSSESVLQSIPSAGCSIRRPHSSFVSGQRGHPGNPACQRHPLTTRLDPSHKA